MTLNYTVNVTTSSLKKPIESSYSSLTLMKSFQPRLVLSPALLSDENRP